MRTFTNFPAHWLFSSFTSCQVNFEKKGERKNPWAWLAQREDRQRHTSLHPQGMAYWAKLSKGREDMLLSTCMLTAQRERCLFTRWSPHDHGEWKQSCFHRKKGLLRIRTTKTKGWTCRKPKIKNAVCCIRSFMTSLKSYPGSILMVCHEYFFSFPFRYFQRISYCR